MLASNGIQLRAVRHTDAPVLYEMAVASEAGNSWRLRGSTLSPQEFDEMLWNGAYCQFTVAPAANPEIPFGLISLINADPRNGVAYLSLLLSESISHNSPAGGIALVLMLRHAFEILGLYKVYAETTEKSLPGVERLESLGIGVHREGVLRNHVRFGDRVDLHLLAVYAHEFHSAADRVNRWVTEPGSAVITPAAVNPPTFSEFATALVAEFEDIGLEMPAVDGGTRLVDDLGLDSLLMVQVLAWMDERWCIGQLAEHQLAFHTVQELFELTQPAADLTMAVAAGGDNGDGAGQRGGHPGVAWR